MELSCQTGCPLCLGSFDNWCEQTALGSAAFIPFQGCSVCDYITVLWNCWVLIKWAVWTHVSLSAVSLPGIDSVKEEIAMQSILPSLLSILSNTVAREHDWITDCSHLFAAGALSFCALFYLTNLIDMDIKGSWYSSHILIHCPIII